MAGQVEDFTPGGVFSGSNINFTAASAGSSSGTGVDTYLSAATLDGVNLLLTLTDGTVYTVNLSSISGGGDSNVTVSQFNLNGDDLTIMLSNGSSATVDLSALVPDTPEDENDYVDSVTLNNNTLTLGRTGDLADLTQDLSVFDNVDNQTGGSRSFTQDGYTYTFTTDNKVVVTVAGTPPPAFTPSENNPEPMNALDTTEISFPAPEANEGFEIADVTVTEVDIKDTDGVTVSTDLDNVTVNDDNTIDVNLPADTAVGDVELEVEVTDTDGDTQTLNPMAELYIPYFTYVSGTTDTYTTVSDFQDDALESTEELPSSLTIAGTGTGRRKYWIMTNGTHSFTNQGLPLSATVAASGNIGEYSYTLYDLGIFGNPFVATEPAPDLAITVV